MPLAGGFYFGKRISLSGLQQTRMAEPQRTKFLPWLAKDIRLECACFARFLMLALLNQSATIDLTCIYEKKLNMDDR
jgi:hypothetical protein